MDNATLRYTAEQRLKDRYGMPIVYMLITLAINLAISYFDPAGVGTIEPVELTLEESLLSLGLSILSFLVSAGLSYGFVVFYQAVAMELPPSLSAGLFSGFTTRYGRSLGMSILISIYVSLWSLLLIIPGIIAAYSYSMAFYLLVREPDLTASDAIARSKRLTTGYKWQIFCLNFSYIGWYLLSILTFGILLLWVVPRNNTAQMLLFEEIYERDYKRCHPEPFTPLGENTADAL